MQLFYQKMLPSDIDLLQRAGRASYEPDYPHLWKPGGLDWYLERCFGRETLERELADPNIAYFLACTADQQLVGLLKLVWEKPMPGGRCDDALF
ncbi:MAG: hypothetical protein JNK89_03150, partial [Saprospiraceae bacterium]|nr:hypothetical protein [Saprospiraceae bacterium]